MMEQGFRGNCDSQGKLGMCPSLAEPDSRGISKSNSRSVSHETRHESESFSMLIASNEPQANQKVFRCSSFSKMLPRCGRAAHICEANLFLRIVVPAAIAFMKTVPFAI